MKRKILAFLGAVMITAGMMNLGVSQGAWAAGCDGTFDNTAILGGLVAWYEGLKYQTAKTTDNKDGKKSVCPDEFSTNNLPTTIGKISGNVLQDLFFVIGVLAVGFGIYAGFLMITAQGDVGQVARAKKTLTRAIVGLVVAILATTIITVIRLVFWK